MLSWHWKSSWKSKVRKWKALLSFTQKAEPAQHIFSHSLFYFSLPQLQRFMFVFTAPNAKSCSISPFGGERKAEWRRSVNAQNANWQHSLRIHWTKWTHRVLEQQHESYAALKMIHIYNTRSFARSLSLHNLSVWCLLIIFLFPFRRRVQVDTKN